jgi:hypothetical protein
LNRSSEHGRRLRSRAKPPNGHGRIVLTGEAAPGERFEGDPDERCTRCGRYLWCLIKVVYEDTEDSDAA